MSLNTKTKYAPNGTLQFIGRFLEEKRLKDAVPMCLIYEDASRHDQLDYRLANLKLAGDGHCIPHYNDLLKDLVKQHLRHFKTENAAALQAQGFWDGTPCWPCWALLNTYWLAPTNDEATTLCLSKEDIYRLCLDRPVIAGRRQAQAADKKCLIFELLSTRPDNCTSWPTYKCASQKLAQLLKCTYSPNSSNRTHSLPYTKTAVYCPQPQGQHQAFCSFVALRYLEISLVLLCFQKASHLCHMLTDLYMLQS